MAKSFCTIGLADFILSCKPTKTLSRIAGASTSSVGWHTWASPLHVPSITFTPVGVSVCGEP